MNMKYVSFQKSQLLLLVYEIGVESDSIGEKRQYGTIVSYKNKMDGDILWC